MLTTQMIEATQNVARAGEQANTNTSAEHARLHSTPDPDLPPPGPNPNPDDVPPPANAPVQEPRQPAPPIKA